VKEGSQVTIGSFARTKDTALCQTNLCKLVSKITVPVDALTYSDLDCVQLTMPALYNSYYDDVVNYAHIVGRTGSRVH
jgi:hypothetical protein